MSTLLTTGTGRPFDITTGLDNDGDLLFSTGRRPVLAGDPGIISTAFGDFDVRPGPAGR